MDFALERSEDRLIGRPKGRVDETNWKPFSQALISAVRQAREAGATLVIDLSELEGLSSRELRVLAAAQREAGDDVGVVLAAPSPQVREILAISRYDQLFAVTEDPAA